jgi:RNA polymerase sigma-70 factor (ECF subfamily)
MLTTVDTDLRPQDLSDEQVVEKVVAGQIELFEVIMRRHNQRLYRAARAILHDDHQAEDVVQDAYVRAYKNLKQFAGRAKFSTWLTRIAVHEALARAHKEDRFEELEPMIGNEKQIEGLRSGLASPEEGASIAEMRGLLEQAMDSLPERYRIVLMLRDVEEMPTAEAARVLDISEDNIKIRLHRARALMRKKLYSLVGVRQKEAFLFHAVRCDRVVKAVFARIHGSDAQEVGEVL